MLLSVTADLVVAAYPACESSRLLQRLEYSAGFVQFKTNEEFSSNSIHQKHLIPFDSSIHASISSTYPIQDHRGVEPVPPPQGQSRCL